MPYVDTNTIHNPATGTAAPATWGDQVRDNLEFLVDPPVCSVYNSGAQSIATATPTTLNANSENFDNDSMHSTVTNNSRITITTPGRYLVSALVGFATNGTGSRFVNARVNGVTTLPGSIGVQPLAANTTGAIYTRTTVLAAGDYIEIRVQQTSGGNLDVTLDEFCLLHLTR